MAGSAGGRDRTATDAEAHVPMQEHPQSWPDGGACSGALPWCSCPDAWEAIASGAAAVLAWHGSTIPWTSSAQTNHSPNRAVARRRERLGGMFKNLAPTGFWQGIREHQPLQRRPIRRSEEPEARWLTRSGIEGSFDRGSESAPSRPRTAPSGAGVEARRLRMSGHHSAD